MKAIRTVGLAVTLIAAVFAGAQLPAQSPAPWTQLLFIEYVDQSTGSGVGLEIFNSSGSTVDLSADSISIRFFNYSTCPTSCPSPTERFLSGQIPPGGTYIVGNPAYCNSCPDSCDMAFAFSGVNGNDAILLTRVDTAIDMIGIPCVCIGPNATSYRVGGVANALYKHNIARCIGNTTHYLDSNGVHVFGNDTTSWPNNQTTNVLGWGVDTDQCITRGHNDNTCGLPAHSLLASARLENCATLLSWPAEKADSFQVMELAAGRTEMVRHGVVYPGPGESQHDFIVHPTSEENSYYQIISWLGGERRMKSDLVKAKRPAGNCLSAAVTLFPVPASDDLFVHLPEPGGLRLVVYDLRGQLIFSHATGTVLQEHLFSVEALSEGVYFYRIVHGNNQLQTGKLLIHRK